MLIALILYRRWGLIVTLLTFYTTDITYGYTIHLATFNVIMKFFINAIELVAGAIVCIKIYFGFAVTINAPAHT